MSVRSALYYWLACDDCDATSSEHSDTYSAWLDQGLAEEVAVEEAAWYVTPDGGHLCDSCARERGIWWCEGCDERRPIVHTDGDELRWCSGCDPRPQDAPAVTR